MTRCAAHVEGEALRADAMREGTRRENATRGRGSSAIEVKEERVAPWNAGVDAGRRAVTTATGCAVSRRSARSASPVDV